MPREAEPPSIAPAGVPPYSDRGENKNYFHDIKERRVKLDVLCVIPARGGSIRLPGKNIKPLNGKPTIAYTIEAWDKSNYRTSPAVVSTDSDEIAVIANRLGTEVLKRPPYLSHGDLPGPHILLKHVIGSLEKYQGMRIGVVILLQPTSPLRTATDIDACLDLYFGGQCDSVTSVCDGKENGAVYVTHASLIQQGNIYGPRLARYEMPAERSIDIDTQADFEEAERLLKGEGEIDNRGNRGVTSGGHDTGKTDDSIGKGKRGGTGKKPTLQRRGR